MLKVSNNKNKTENNKVTRKDVIIGLIDFRPVEEPKWRQKPEKPISKMLEDIQDFQILWDEKKSGYDAKKVALVARSMEAEFYHFVASEEGHGLSTLEETRTLLSVESSGKGGGNSKEERVVLNICHAYEYLKTILNNDKENIGMLDPVILKEAHEKVLKNVNLGSKTRAGEFSNVDRYTEYKGEKYHYNQVYKDLTTEECVQLVIDRFNPLIDYAKKQEKRIDRIDRIFKAVAYLVFEMLDVHPFSDGNGRLCRLLASYILASMTPFPTPVYNVWSKSSKGDYVDALVEARKTKDRHPALFMSMIIECNWYAWREFFHKLDSSLKKN